MEAPPLRIAVAGLGFMGVTHLRGWQKVTGACVAALYNASGRRLDGDFSDVSGNLGEEDALRLDMTQIKAYRDYAALLADPEIDVIDICTPTHTHHDLALAALQAGKHVLCEKPLARTAADALEMEQAAQKAGRQLMAAMCLRFWPEWHWLKEAVASQRYGRVLSARFTRIAEAPSWGQEFFMNSALSGGALLDLHVHDADFIRYVFGQPRQVHARGYTKVSGGIDHVMVHYDYDANKGPWVQAEGSWAMSPGFGFRMAYTVNFEQATADYDSSRSSEALLLSHEAKKAAVQVAATTGHALMLQHFTDNVRKGVCSDIIPPLDASASLALIELEEKLIRESQG
jgi:predicted dehydrogenase